MKRIGRYELTEALKVLIVVLWMGSFIVALAVCAYSLKLMIACLIVFLITTGIIEQNKDHFRINEEEED